jgi:glutamate/tyrosine decarboxylase-like PLP-dependent enzyme
VIGGLQGWEPEVVMAFEHGLYDKALDRAADHARAWLDSVGTRPVGPRATADELLGAFASALPHDPTAPEDVVDLLALLAEPGLMAIGSGRFFGWVMGGTQPAALGADWLVSAWDQNAGMRFATPAVVAAEEAAAAWILELLGLPPGADVGFVTGATMANFTGLAAARTSVLSRVGWDVAADGLAGAPRIEVFAGAERHGSVDLALRYLGLGAARAVAADEQGRIDVDALVTALAGIDTGAPAIVCLQAGNLHSGAFDPFADAIEIAHRHGAWVHVDGAFGLWAAAAPSLRHLSDGLAAADSWATDAHKTLNTPYDCGIAVVADQAAMRTAMGVHASYLITDDPGVGDPFEKAPEMSRRARGVPVWAALRSMGRTGVRDLIERLVQHARAIADGVAALDGVAVLNDVVYTQVCLAFGDDARTRAVAARLLADGTTWMSGSRWHDRDVVRVSVSNWSTDDADVRLSIDAVARAIAGDGS